MRNANQNTQELTPAQKGAITRAKNKALRESAERTKKVNAEANKKAQSKLKSKQLPKKKVKSKGQLKREARVQQLTDMGKNRTLTTRELTWLFSADIYLESRSISSVYNFFKKYFANTEENNNTGKDKLKQLTGKNTLPKFSDFADKMPDKFLFSYFDGLRVLAKFNKKAKTASKVKRQNKATAKK
jgi:hypothetical protein